MQRCGYCGGELLGGAVFCCSCGKRVAGESECTDYRYEAFISYRHLPRDRKVAMRLQRSLEGMRIPKEVRSKLDAPSRLGKLFRDEDELPTSASLSDQIQDALVHSHFLIVVCSPHFSESRWCTREVELFASLHGRDHILVALAEGEPEQSYPALLRVRAVRGEQGRTRFVPEEPLAADFRSDDRRRFLSERLRVAAALIGCGYDDLRQRVRVRRTRIIVAAAVLVALVSTAFGAVSWYQHMLIAKNYRQAQINESEMLATAANELLASGKRTEAIQVALSALPSSSTSDDRPFVPAAQLALEEALEVYPTSKLWRSSYSVGNVTSEYAYSSGGLQAMLQTDDTILITKIDSGEEISRIDLSGLREAYREVYDMDGSGVDGFVFCGENLLCGVRGGVGLFDAQTGDLLWSQSVEGTPLSSYGGCVATAPDASFIVLCMEDREVIGVDSGSACVRVVLLDASSGKEQNSYALPLPKDASILLKICVAVSDDGKTLAIATEGTLACVNTTSGEIKAAATSQRYIYDMALLGQYMVVMCSEDDYATAGNGTVATIDVFDKDLKKRWSKDEAAQTSYSPLSFALSPQLKVVGALSGEGGADDTSLLAIMSGPSVVVYEFDSGKESYRFERESSLLDCAILKDAGGHGWLVAIDGSGTLVRRNPTSGVSTVVGSPYDLEMGATLSATLASCDGGTYLASHDRDKLTYRVFRYVGRGEDIKTQAAKTDARSYSVGWGDAHCVGWDDAHCLYGYGKDGELLVRLDTNTFEPLWSCDLVGLGFADNAVDCTVCQDSVYVYSGSSKKLVRLSSDDGAILDTYEVTDDSSSSSMGYYGIAGVEPIVNEGNGERLLLRMNPVGLLLLDTQTKDVLFTYNDESVTGMDDVEYCGASVVCSVTKDGVPAYVALSLADGHEVSGDLAQCPASASANGAWTVSPDRRLFVTSGSDGCVRLYDTGDWSLVWEAAEVPALVQMLFFSADSQCIVLQDTSGSLLLLSSATGETLCASSTTLPPIEWCFYDERDQGVVWARYSAGGIMSSYGLAKVCLGEEAFGPSSDVYTGVVLSDDDKTALSYNSSLGKAGIIEVYTLDELIEMAKDEVADRPLSDAERYMYHIP